MSVEKLEKNLKVVKEVKVVLVVAMSSHSRDVTWQAVQTPEWTSF
jgi:hypothetical protein